MNELAVIDNTVTELISLSAMPKDQIVKEMDRNYLASLVRANPNLNREDFVTFVTKCQLTGADPRLNQVYLTVHNSWNSQKRISEPKGTTIFAYQFMLQKAHETGELESLSVETKREPYLDLMSGRERASITAYARVKRKGKAEITYAARFWEFAKTDKEGNLTGTWKTGPHLMLEKCAIACALRWAFPEILSGVDVKEEMEKVVGDEGSHEQDHVKVHHRPVQQRPAQIPVETVSQPSAPDLSQNADFIALKGDLLEFVQSRSDEWFNVLGLSKSSMLRSVTEARTIDIITTMSQKVAAHDDRYNELTRNVVTAEVKADAE